MSNFSVTYTGVIIFFIGYLFKLAGIPFVQGQLEQTIDFVITFAGVITALYGRYRHGDLNLFGTKRIPDREF